MCNCRLSRKCI